MALTLFKLPSHPNEIAVSKIGSFVENGLFFLDFSRPLEIVRWLGVRNRWIGFPVALGVPIVHQGQLQSEFNASVFRTEPYFADIRELWRQRYPQKRTPPATETDGLKIIADFGTQFPDNA